MDVPANPDSIVRAWTDPVARAQMAEGARAALPLNPAGDIDLPELPAEEGQPIGA
ncbi:mersacidin/lichenicidin family type 2 lantibiotic [Actinoplanes sp. NEAU-A12]|uniref:Mersacidin/lichenicidin family type 2 lantibiotic n=1 Tax=Actinoplanes sandaracinus TaxID=3045177 RepID=A0ABT6WRD2_9ACTN|nr:mersacidin/lichenicidin family type 2 lantibiotic [Actinoplanes sandaracinus]MDI6102274.1 mersacidin/lichenicidin family type 2 lantibiotic [Actinoplanes sandaracinus]